MPRQVMNFLLNIRQKNDYRIWKKNACPMPPPHFLKQCTIQKYQREYGYTILIETGTYLGDMIEAQKNEFKQIISIELSLELCRKAQTRFKNYGHIKIMNGDSGKILAEVMKEIHQPAIFWLDGHYSEGITARGDKECPVSEELMAIFKNNLLKHVILIDDARFFTGVGDFPSISELSEFISIKNPGYQIEIENDIIRCTVSK